VAPPRSSDVSLAPLLSAPLSPQSGAENTASLAAQSPDPSSRARRTSTRARTPVISILRFSSIPSRISNDSNVSNHSFNFINPSIPYNSNNNANPNSRVYSNITYIPNNPNNPNYTCNAVSVITLVFLIFPISRITVIFLNVVTRIPQTTDINLSLLS
jgi:hypothetical protein